MPALTTCRSMNLKENYKISVMKKEDGKINSAEEVIVIPDECGDSMWDVVLEQSPFIQALKQGSETEADNKNQS